MSVDRLKNVLRLDGSAVRARMRDVLDHVDSTGANIIIQHYGKDRAALVSLATLEEHMSESRPAQLLLVWNNTGGAGKSVTARDLADTLTHEHGLRVALVDMDPQGDLSSMLGVDLDGQDDALIPLTVEELQALDSAPARLESGSVVPLDAQFDLDAMLAQLEASLNTDGGPDPAAQTLYNAILRLGPIPHPVRVHNFDLYPGSLILSNLETRIPQMPLGEARLKEVLDQIAASGQYDIVLIDAPPTLSKITLMALIAAQHLVVVTPSRRKGIRAAANVLHTVRDMRTVNPKLNVLAFIVTRYVPGPRSSRDWALTAQHRLRIAVGPITERPAVYESAERAHTPARLVRNGADAQREISHVARVIAERLGVARPTPVEVQR